jgi:hypothetical protein
MKTRNASNGLKIIYHVLLLLAGPSGPDYRPGIRMRPEVAQKWSR